MGSNWFIKLDQDSLRQKLIAYNMAYNISKLYSDYHIETAMVIDDFKKMLSKGCVVTGKYLILQYQVLIFLCLTRNNEKIELFRVFMANRFRKVRLGSYY